MIVLGLHCAPPSAPPRYTATTAERSTPMTRGHAPRWPGPRWTANGERRYGRRPAGRGLSSLLSLPGRVGRRVQLAAWPGSALRTPGGRVEHPAEHRGGNEADASGTPSRGHTRGISLLASDQVGGEDARALLSGANRAASRRRRRTRLRPTGGGHTSLSYYWSAPPTRRRSSLARPPR